MKAYKKHYKTGELVYYVNKYNGVIGKGTIKNAYVFCYGINIGISVDTEYLASRNSRGLKYIKKISKRIINSHLSDAQDNVVYYQNRVSKLNSYLNKLEKYK